MTNAHVVAGATDDPGRDRRPGDADATGILLDLALDVAVLYAPGLDAPALRFARATRTVAIIGPRRLSGWRAAVLPAAVAATYSATGRDMNGTTPVRARIVELRARSSPATRGGPFLDDGTVGGLVFADRGPTTGRLRALPDEVADRIAPAIGRTGAVDVGPVPR